MPKIILVIAVIAVVSIGGYFIYNAYQSPAYQATTPGTASPAAPEANTPAAGSQQQTQTTITTTTTTTTQPPIPTSAITIQNFSFNPAALTVKEGTTVIWTNQDPMPHQIKSATFNSSPLSNGQSFQFTFSAAGQYDYSCAIHPSMHGKITVTK